MSGRDGRPRPWGGTLSRAAEEPLKVVLALGNPGARYAGNRHNIGFRVADLLASRAGARFVREPGLGGVCETARFRTGEEDSILAKPRTYMNRSGRAALALLGACGAGPGELLVVHDEADLDLGRIRILPEGGAGGHNGVRSLIDALGTREFARIRLGVRGVGRESAELADYVLADFDPEERPVVERLVVLGADAVEAVLAEGMESARGRFHGLRAGAGA